MKRLLFLAMLFLITACTKTEQIQPEYYLQKDFNPGLLPDDPKAVAKIPLITSKSFLKAKQTSVIAKGRPVKDQEPPTVRITSPLTGAAAEGIINVSVTATDNVGVTQVALKINGVTLAIDYTAPYTFVWDATNVPAGTYLMTASVRDAARNVTDYSIMLIKEVIVVEPPTQTATFELTTPTAGNQGSEGSCVAWSVGYSARSIDWYYKTEASSYSLLSNIFSPEFLYNQIKFSTDCNSGSAMQTALDFIKVNGICTWSVMPYNNGDCNTLPDVNQSSQALPYTISGYHKIYTSDTTAIKSLLHQNKAVIVSILLDSYFLNAKPGFIWENTGSGFGVGHSVIICGYSDELKAWKIMNSFGTNWGTNGFGYMKYDMFPTRTGTYCYAII
jgi:hypothetical protein